MSNATTAYTGSARQKGEQFFKKSGSPEELDAVRSGMDEIVPGCEPDDKSFLFILPQFHGSRLRHLLLKLRAAGSNGHLHGLGCGRLY